MNANRLCGRKSLSWMKLFSLLYNLILRQAKSIMTWAAVFMYTIHKWRMSWKRVNRKGEGKKHKTFMLNILQLFRILYDYIGFVLLFSCLLFFQTVIWLLHAAVTFFILLSIDHYAWYIQRTVNIKFIYAKWNRELSVQMIWLYASRQTSPERLREKKSGRDFSVEQDKFRVFFLILNTIYLAFSLLATKSFKFTCFNFFFSTQTSYAWLSAKVEQNK